jgi:lipopolysaccharide transport system ATP-binding protein
MSDAVITVEGISKRYLLGKRRSKDDGIRHLMEDALRAPLRWLRSRRESSESGPEEYWALKDVSFEVKRGEVVGIVGRNGAGKSTLLKILSRITEPTSGRIGIDGRVASLLEVGTGFHPELTGRENIFLNGAILGMSRVEIKRKFDEIVAFSEVEKFLDTPVKRYSSGMYVRLAFAVAAHLEPEILIVDEVLAVGDAQFQRKCMGKMGEISRQHGRTILFVSHNIAAIRNLCSHCVMLEKGRVKASGITESVIAAYLREDKAESKFSRAQVLGGDGRVIIEDLEVTNPTIQTGSTFEAVLHLNRPTATLEPLWVEFAIDLLSDQETRVLQIYSRNVDQKFLVPPGRSAYRIKLDSLPLAPGAYRLGVWAGFGHVTFDLVANCSAVTVESGCFVAGVFVENRGIPVVVPSHWQAITSTILNPTQADSLQTN